jgi:Uma2 family endonuclease
MTAIVTSQKIHSPQEYLALETAATTRHEYRNGEVLEMTGWRSKAVLCKFL